MSKLRKGGYIFVSWIGDHENHVHIYRDGRLIAKWNITAWCEEPGSKKISAKIKRLLQELEDQPRTKVRGTGMSGRGLHPDPRSGRVATRPKGRGFPFLDEGTLGYAN